MKTLSNTAENNAKVKALKKINETLWVGNTVHPNLQYCLEAIKLITGVNSGHYNPIAVSLSGVNGYFMVNQDGSLNCECRVIKIDGSKFRIEEMTMPAWNQFEQLYSEFLNAHSRQTAAVLNS